MQIKMRGEKIKITPAIDSYVSEKVGKLDKYFENPEEISANILVRIRGIEQIVEVTIPIKNAVIRAEERSKDLYEAIDLVVDKLERQIRKNKTKIQKKKNKVRLPEFNIDYQIEEKEETKGKIVKEKIIETKPMSREEAILQMELVDHDFYVFKDDKTLETSVVYRRKDGNYGVIDAK
ncbi:MAG: ribosome-associated translation inhibitor RaiA [Firmicutes bacterium]|nr:ribosome-associated translation inhibitor RaiA [Bacillota bacterium]